MENYQSKHRILVISENLQVLKRIRERLSSKGYSVFTATNFKGAFTLIQKINPQLILCDIIEVCNWEKINELLKEK